MESKHQKKQVSAYRFRIQNRRLLTYEKAWGKYDGYVRFEVDTVP